MTDEHTFRSALGRLARDLQTEATRTGTLQRVTDAAVDLIGPCEAAGISLVARNGTITTTAATGEVPARGDELQIALGEGPCMDVIWQERTIEVPVLSGDDRWPSWGPRAVEELGVRSMLCLRLFTNEDTVGALNLYATHEEAFHEVYVDQAHALAAHAAVAAAGSEQVENLERALDTRTVIGQAVGLVMARYQMDSGRALGLLKRLSMESNTKVVTLASSLVMQHDADLGVADGVAATLRSMSQPIPATGDGPKPAAPAQPE